MHCIEAIVKMNSRRPARHEDWRSRLCSFAASRGGVVLHSAKLRSTAFLADPTEVAKFLRRARPLRAKTARSAAAREKFNRLVESYF